MVHLIEDRATIKNLVVGKMEIMVEDVLPN